MEPVVYEATVVLTRLERDTGGHPYVEARLDLVESTGNHKMHGTAVLRFRSPDKAPSVGDVFWLRASGTQEHPEVVTLTPGASIELHALRDQIIDYHTEAKMVSGEVPVVAYQCMLDLIDDRIEALRLSGGEHE